MVAMWGGTGISYYMDDKVNYIASCIKFSKVTEKFGCDAEICTHPFVDEGIERLKIVRSITDGVPNPFVLGKENYKYYENTFLENCLKALAAKAKEADKLLPPQPLRK